MFFRYPGGKKKLKKHIIQKLVEIQSKNKCLNYCEPFFGGGAIGIEFLKHANIKNLVLSDKDVGIAALWTSVIRYHEDLKNKISSFVPSVDCFYKYKDILLHANHHDDKDFYIDYGFMKIAIHQISYSGLGVKSGGPLGGRDQNSKYKIDCRWSPVYINKRIDELHNLLTNFEIYNNSCLCCDFEESINKLENCLIYLDPPYYIKGNDLYQCGFTDEDHARLSKLLKTKQSWLLSYDDCEEIKKMYSWANTCVIDANYSITSTIEERENHKRKGNQELLIEKPQMTTTINFKYEDLQAILKSIADVDLEKQLTILEATEAIKAGNIFEFNHVNLLDAVVGLKNIPSEYADIVVIDPPYNIGKNFGNNFDNLELDEYVEWSKKWIEESIRITKRTGTIYIYGISEILAHLSVEINLPKRWLIWHYTNKNTTSNLFWQRSHESILCVWKSEDRIFNLDDVREPYTDVFLKNAAGKKRKATPGRFSKTNTETIYNAHEKGALPRDVIKIPALAGGAGKVERFSYCKDCNDIFICGHINHNIINHPTQKPIELSKRLLMAAKPENDGIVVVPFAGTGNELLAAKQLDMRAIGFEINEDYFTMANLLLNKGFPH